MKESNAYFWITFSVVLGIFFIGILIGRDIGKNEVSLTKDSRDIRRVECDLADVKARLATLERVRIEVNLTDKTSTWFVKDGKVE